MFTGIVAEMGSVVAVEPTGTGRRLVIGTNGLSDGMALGDSISVNGVCLTAVDVSGTKVTVDVVQETLDGLFLMVGEEEKRIRRDPAARVTELLRRVFGS